MDIDQDFTTTQRPRTTPLLDRTQIHNCVHTCSMTGQKYLDPEKVKEAIKDLNAIKLKPYEKETMLRLDSEIAEKFVIFRKEEIEHLLGDCMKEDDEEKE